MVVMPYSERIILSEDTFIEADIKETDSGLKFSLVLVRNKERIVGFDNYEGKEPHKHVKGKTFPYKFVNVDKLVEDFYVEIANFL